MTTNLFEPLPKFEVVLEPSFDQLVDRNHLINSLLPESTLQDLEVFDVVVVVLGVKLDLLHGHAAGEEHVHELAVRRTCT